MQRLLRFRRFTHILPADVADKITGFGEAPFFPEIVQRVVACRPQRMVFRSHDGAEGGIVEAVQAPGPAFPFLEKTDADAAAPVIFIQNGLAVVKYSAGIKTMVPPGFSDAFRLVFHRFAGGDAHHLIAVESDDDNAVGGVEEGAEVVLLILHRAVVEVGEIPEYADPEAGQVGEKRMGGSAGVGLDVHDGVWIGELVF